MPSSLRAAAARVAPDNASNAAVGVEIEGEDAVMPQLLEEEDAGGSDVALRLNHHDRHGITTTTSQQQQLPLRYDVKERPLPPLRPVDINSLDRILCGNRGSRKRCR